MKFFTTLLFLMAIAFCGCTDDKPDNNPDTPPPPPPPPPVANHQEWNKSVNSSVSMLSLIVKAYESGDFVKGLVSSDGVGSSIDFLHAPDLSIINGTRGSASILSIKKDADGKYYWTYKGDWLLNDQAKMLASAIAPQLRVSVISNNWEISTNSGSSWIDTAEKAVGDDLLSSNGIVLTDNTLEVILADGQTKLIFPIYIPMALGNPDNSDPIIMKRYKMLQIPVRIPSGLNIANYSKIDVKIIKGNASLWKFAFRFPSYDEEGNCFNDAKVFITPDLAITVGEKATIEMSIVDKQGEVFSSATRDIEFKSFELGDYYPDYDNPATAIGIIYELDAKRPRSGKMISINEHSSLLWGIYNTDVAIDADNGLNNMVAIRNIDPSFDKYPSFSWANSLNSLPKSASMTWYVPAIEELVKFYTFWSANKTVYNKKFTDAGGLAILGGSGFSIRYWSSTGVFAGLATALDFTNGNKNNIDKELFHRVRAFSTFDPDASDLNL